jgi:integrase
LSCVDTFCAYKGAYMQLDRRLTDSLARSLSPPKEGYEIYWCSASPGFGLRVTASGSRAWVMERRVAGKTVRRTLGKASGRGAISVLAARNIGLLRSADLERGKDELEIRRAEAKREKRDVSFAQAVKEYVETKRRGKDGLPLKPRTKADYLAMVQSGGIGKNGKPRADGELYSIAAKQISKIAGDDLRRAYEQLLGRGERRASYAMQVVRAVLNWHGVAVENNPLSRSVAGRDRIVLRPTTGKPNPVPAAKLGAWWHAACKAGTDGNPGFAKSADFLRFVLLTGVRGGEAAGSEHLSGIRVRDFDQEAGLITLRDTKNRRDFTVFLSTQALEIAKRHARGKRASAPLFEVRDPGKTLDAVCAMAGIERRSLHAIRKTFASVAEGLVTGYCLRRMMNHVDNDVTGEFYIHKSEQQLRAAWQQVADFIEGSAATFSDLHHHSAVDRLVPTIRERKADSRRKGSVGPTPK